MVSVNNAKYHVHYYTLILNNIIYIFIVVLWKTKPTDSINIKKTINWDLQIVGGTPTTKVLELKEHQIQEFLSVKLINKNSDYNKNKTIIILIINKIGLMLISF